MILGIFPTLKYTQSYVRLREKSSEHKRGLSSKDVFHRIEIIYGRLCVMSESKYDGIYDDIAYL